METKTTTTTKKNLENNSKDCGDPEKFVTSF